MGDPGSYAKVVPLMRYLKSRLLGPKVRDLSPPLSEAVAVVRDSIYSKAAEAKDLGSLERALSQLYFSMVDEAYGLSPPEAARIASAFGRVVELEDLMIVARALAEGEQLPQWLPSSEWRMASTQAVLQELSVSPTITRLPELVRDRDLRKAVEGALEAYSELRQGEAFTFYSLVGSSLMLRTASEGLDKQDALAVENVVCPLVEERAALGLLEAWALRLNPKTFMRAIEGPRVCGVDWDFVAGAYERGMEGDVAALAVDASAAFRYVKLEGRSLWDLMLSVRRSGRSAAVRQANAAFEGYPFSPAIIAGGLTLLMLEMDDVRTALGSIILGLKQDEFSHSVL